MSTLTAKERAVLEDVHACGGYEVHKSMEAIFIALAKRGLLAAVSGFRGPRDQFKRYQITDIGIVRLRRL